MHIQKSLLLPLLLTSFGALASGLSKPVIVGPKAVGMGGAFMGIADDPTAIFHNPAGITQLKGHNFYLGMDGLITQLEYTPPTTGVAEHAKQEFLPVPSFAYTTDVFKYVTVGLGVFFPHGNGGKFSAASGFPTNPNEGRIYSMEISPTVAYEIIDNLSIGGSFRLVRISSSIKGQLFPALSTTIDNLDVSGWGYAAAASIFYKPFPEISFGANYRSKVKSTLSGDVTLNPAVVAATEADLEQVLPTQISGGVGLYPVDGLTIGLGYSFEKNSEIDSFNATLKSTPSIPVTLPQNWGDSHTVHIGAEYWFVPSIAGRIGYAKDLRASIPDAAMNRIVGDIAAEEISAGAAYKYKDWEFGLTWNARFGTREVPLTTTNPGPGKYEAFVQAISAGVTTRL